MMKSLPAVPSENKSFIRLNLYYQYGSIETATTSILPILKF